MRLYAYTNMYLEGIHSGIQTAHLIGELVIKYTSPDTDPRAKVLADWLCNHKTIFVYNGGLQDTLWQRQVAFREFADKFSLPMARFNESKEALNGALTCVGIVVPEQYYRSHLIPRSSYPVAATNGLGEILRQPKTDEERFYELLHNCERAR